MGIGVLVWLLGLGISYVVHSITSAIMPSTSNTGQPESTKTPETASFPIPGVCTSYTDAHPPEETTVYALGEGETQKFRADVSVGAKEQHIIVKSGKTYVWNNWSRDTEKFRNEPVSYWKYFNLEGRPHLQCYSWAGPDYSQFDLPATLTFTERRLHP
jgi:hypothetical protein